VILATALGNAALMPRIIFEEVRKTALRGNQVGPSGIGQTILKTAE
jgi:hypothetical protein